MTARATIPAPEPGVYRQMPAEHYHALDAASNSRLAKLRRSPLHLRAYLDGADEETSALAIGRAIHTAILEPDYLTMRYTTAGQCEATVQKSGERCKNSGILYRAESGWLCGVHGKGLTSDDERAVLSPSDYTTCIGVRDSVRAHPIAGELLADVTDTELTMVWDDERTGVRCKGRMDAHAPAFTNGTALDVKSTVDASKSSFQRAIFAHSYHCQGAMYLDGAARLALPAEHFAILAVEKARPWAVAVYRLADSALLVGREEVSRSLELYRECAESDRWPGYSPCVEDIHLPAWARTYTDLLGAFQ